MSTAAPVRFAAYYGAFYLTFGAFLPYFPKWLEGRDLSAESIGLIVAAGLAGRTLVSPLGARWADQARRRRSPILAFAVLCLLVFALHTPQWGAPVLALLSFLSGAFLFGQIPLIDAFAMRAASREGFAFGPVRAVGSALFIVSNFVAGAMINAAGSESVLYWMIFGTALITLAAAFLPAGEQEDPASAGGADWVRLGRLIYGPFGLALAASALVQGAHGFYYAFSAVAWTAQGHNEVLIGALWSTGVAIEIVFLWLSGRGLLGRLSPAVLLGVGAAASILRWGLTALAPPLWALFALQLLHALTFAATYVGFLRYAVQSVPDRYAATAQAINSALSGGVVMAAASAVSGYFFARIGVGGFAIMIVPAVLGLMAAIALWRVSPLTPTQKID